MRIFKTKGFTRIASKDLHISDVVLKKTVEELNRGNYDANLGGHVYKIRLGMENRGKSNGARTIVCFKKNDKAIFLDAYAKNDKENLSIPEEQLYKKFAKVYFAWDDSTIDKALRTGDLLEVK